MENQYLIQINSNDPGKHCDLYPARAVFLVEKEGDKLSVVTRRNSYIPPEFDIVKLSEGTELKECPYCKNSFTKDTQFMDGRKNKDDFMCVTCFERRNITGDKYLYKGVLRSQIIAELRFLNEQEQKVLSRIAVIISSEFYRPILLKTLMSHYEVDNLLMNVSIKVFNIEPKTSLDRESILHHGRQEIFDNHNLKL